MSHKLWVILPSFIILPANKSIYFKLLHKRFLLRNIFDVVNNNVITYDVISLLNLQIVRILFHSLRWASLLSSQTRHPYLKLCVIRGRPNRPSVSGIPWLTFLIIITVATYSKPKRIICKRNIDLDQGSPDSSPTRWRSEASEFMNP